MKKRIIRAALMALAVITVLSAAFVFPSFGGNNEAVEAETELLHSDGEATEEVVSSDSLPEVLAGGTIGQSSGFSAWLTGLRRVLYFGGSQYVNDGGIFNNHFVSGFDEIVEDMRNVIQGLGCCIMFVCWIFGMCKSGISLNFDPGAKDGIIWSGLSLLIGLFLMGVSMEIMESLSVMCWAFCAELYEYSDMGNALNSVTSSINSSGMLSGIWEFLKEGAIDIMSWIIEAVLVLNVAYMGLLQCFSPIFIGFAAGGEGTRRIATGFFKEYLRVCIVPSIVVVYSSLCFHLFAGSSVGWFLCIVLGISIFGIKNKLDKIIT